MYFFYIDDSGNRDPALQGTRRDGTTFVKDHLYVLTAVTLFERRWAAFEAELTDHKLRLRSALHKQTGLQTDISDCDVKSTYMRVPKERQSKSPFLHALTDDQRLALTECYYSQLTKHNMHTFAVVIDKRHLHAESDSFFLHKMAYEILLERFEMFLRERHPSHKGVVVMDDADRALNRAVAIKHAALLHLGGKLRYRQMVEYPFFTESRLSHGVQLADLCAYNVYRAFRHQDFSYPFFARMLPHFYNSNNTEPGKLDGLKVFPDASPLAEWARTNYLNHLKTTKPAGEAGFGESEVRLG